MSGWLPKSPKARRRLTLLAAIAPVLALAVGLTLWGLSDSISFFYTPSQADAAKPPAGRTVQLGGLVEAGSVVKHPDGRVEFTVRDSLAADRIVFQGDLPDLFREGQGIVATGAYREDGVFQAKQVLAKHDERYMPREVSKALKEQGEWRGDGEKPSYDAPRKSPVT
ncbi:MAG: cytochrome c maturation protein CcmE [Phenylobacterium sp.]|uniref:cytochrome c maturation protein CcmE n=1 Tax=Phenylobacterium sp. TaxID=1871053 RepID=UPI00271A4EE0|nr:cytochrome c maturation protein CcmE [Phenylobacterium sp.]MDO8912700.1 cytochrome c maturation protein CcmE [Phenylobacterium sp.]MDP2012161.1 cytochrome c maturation protein CcmE [Phenylobacterium sp.]MDP3101966.1 cytochrome c maturation protein CcmE [Phenylobacterium sp.]MDP3635385.1 cytochrome c maturation protein CcmE [Phenylobacterium sp.]MDP3867090.1 cytochrome c maturation protein CcmE [Phenylobacterium sp.]